MRYIEYDKASGRILSEINSENAPKVFEGIGLIELEDGDEIDTTAYAVRRGVLIKTAVSSQERRERERIRRENQEKLRLRLNSMCREAMIAILADDAEELENLRKEYRRMKAGL